LLRTSDEQRPIAEMTIEVRTPVFSGPFDLLLHLITGNQVEIYDISLAEIVDDYLKELERLGEIDLDSATEFLLIASILIELKSARLLRSKDGGALELDAELAGKRDYLIAKLLEHKTFKKAAEAIGSRLIAGRTPYPRAIGPDERYASVMPPLLQGVTPEMLAALAAEVFARSAPQPSLEMSHIYVPPVRFSQVLVSTAERTQAARHITFRDLTASCTSRLEVGLHFLAVLELYKQELVDIEQFRTFGEITVIWRGGERFPVEELLQEVSAEAVTEMQERRGEQGDEHV